MQNQSALQIDELEIRALSFPEKARLLTVNSAQEFEYADRFIGSVKELRKEIQDTFGPLKERAFLAHKAIVAEEKRHEEPLIEAEKIVRRLMVAYRQREEANRLRREAELREIARRQEDEAKLAAALEAEARGEKEEAAAILEEEVYSPPIILTPEVPKAKSVRFSTTWTFRIIDVNKIPREYMLPDMVKIGFEARSKKGDTRIPGIEVYPRPEGV